MGIIAYTYLASIHCPRCARSALYNQKITQAHPGPAQLDEHGLPVDMIDREGNTVIPVFTIDEIEPDDVCDDCFCPLRKC